MAIHIPQLGGATTDSNATNKIFVTVQNYDAAVLEKDKVVAWAVTTTDSLQGYAVTLAWVDSNDTLGLSGQRVAGVVSSTINTGGVGRIQVWGPAQVRASASLNVSAAVVTGSNNATNFGHVFEASAKPAGLEMVGALVGWTMENGPTATQSRVFLTCM